MNKEIGLQWAAALESEEYKQGRNALNCGGRYCCLGVLCELAVKAEIIPPGIPERTREAYLVYGDVHGTSTVFLPQSVGSWAELPDSHQYVEMNDQNFASFEEIALAIRREIENQNTQNEQN